MNKVLILFAHPALEKSRVNLRLIREVRDLPGITFHDLYETYPDFLIDVKREQKLMEDHQIIVLQHPFYWYSTPAILKEWQELGYSDAVMEKIFHGNAERILGL